MHEQICRRYPKDLFLRVIIRYCTQQVRDLSYLTTTATATAFSIVLLFFVATSRVVL